MTYLPPEIAVLIFMQLKRLPICSHSFGRILLFSFISVDDLRDARENRKLEGANWGREWAANNSLILDHDGLLKRSSPRKTGYGFWNLKRLQRDWKLDKSAAAKLMLELRSGDDDD